MDANRALGLPDDCREYSSVQNILADLDIKSIRLLVSRHPACRLGACTALITTGGWLLPGCRMGLHLLLGLVCLLGACASTAGSHSQVSRVPYTEDTGCCVQLHWLLTKQPCAVLSKQSRRLGVQPLCLL